MLDFVVWISLNEGGYDLKRDHNKKKLSLIHSRNHMKMF